MWPGNPGASYCQKMRIDCARVEKSEGSLLLLVFHRYSTGDGGKIPGGRTNLFFSPNIGGTWPNEPCGFSLKRISVWSSPTIFYDYSHDIPPFLVKKRIAFFLFS